MKKIIIFIITLLLQINLLQAANLDVQTNLESWEYEFVIEVNIIANDKNAKIFYYTDWEWRMDNIKEFKKPLIIKEDTQLDYYATNTNYEDTLIKTSNYTFNYSKKIDITWDENKIIIKNNSWDIQNIWYWQIEANNLSYEINPNTFLENKDTFELNYVLEDNEEIKLISPDKKVVKSFVYKKKSPPLNLPLAGETSSNPPPAREGLGEGENTKTTKNTNSWSIENPPILSDIPLDKGELNQSKTEEIIEKKEFDLEENLKTSTLDTKKTWNKNNIYIIILIFGSLILYNVWLLLTKTEVYKKIKNKSKK